MAILKVRNSRLQTLIFVLYRTLLVAGLPFILAYLIGRGIKNRAYWQSFGERFGFLSFRATVPGAIWLHAVSVGEVLPAVGLVARLRSAFPESKIYVSVATLAGRQLAEQRLATITDGLFFAPLDFVFVIRRVLRALEPALVVVMETEIWPNLFRETKLFGAQLVIVNGRISDRTFPKYNRFRWFFQHVLSLPDKVLTQSAQDSDRYLALGAPPDLVTSVGNLKYDFDPSSVPAPEAVLRLLERTTPELVLIAASTMPGISSSDVDEDDAVIQAFGPWSGEFPKLLLILVPRRPDRFDMVADKLSTSGIHFLRRSKLNGTETLQLPSVLLLDTMGELGSLFSVADLVFMGGTIAQRGGHNILEPAFFGKPVIAGPHMENFAEIASEFTKSGGLVRFQEAQELGPAVAKLLKDKQRRKGVGKQAEQLATARRGATNRILDVLQQHFDFAVPERYPPLWQRMLLLPLVVIWRSISHWNIARKARNAKQAPAPVISIGGLGMGGSGKTPFVLWLAARLRERGETPAFLTRGYRRKSVEKVSVFAPGSYCSVAHTGEEAQMLIRSALGPVGISANRWEAASALVEQFQTSVMLLDDGFQHTQLARSVDVVLIDTLDPFPLTRLREWPESLSRATMIVLTRCTQARQYRGLVAKLRQWNKTAPVFQSRVVPLALVEASSSETITLDQIAGKRIAAFCGLGNPASFWKTLEQLQVNIVYRWTFGDHHHYKPKELQRLEEQAMSEEAELLITTQKDFLNLPASWKEVLTRLPFYWLDVELEVDKPEELLKFVTLNLKKNTLHV